MCFFTFNMQSYIKFLTPPICLILLCKFNNTLQKEVAVHDLDTTP